MGEFILILILTRYSGAAATSILFPTKQACEVAREMALTEFDKSLFSPRAVCVPRNAS